MLLVTMLFISASVLQAQDITVTGTVKDATGEPVIGASILDPATNVGTISDYDGNFSIRVGKTAVLKVSYIGYQTKNVRVEGKSNLHIALQENTELLDEVVVVGYGVSKKSDLTGSVSSVSSKDLKNAAVANVGEALQGRASGVQIINSGAPGSNVSIKIRGLGTINDSNPLLVIDGVPTDLALNALNMDDVQSVDVLKDASATAIYGSRGANGVIIITTKKGKAGKATLSFKANYGIQKATSVPELLNAAEYAALSNDMMENARMDKNPAWVDPSSLGKGTDWMNELLQNGHLQDYALSYSGGGENNTYYVSAGILEQSGIVRNTDYRRYTFQFNNDAKVFSWLKFANNLTFSHDVKKNGSYNVRNTMAALPTQSVKNDDGSWSGPDGQAYWVGDIRNPIGTTELNKSTTKGYNLLGNISAEIFLFKGFSFKTTGGLDAKFWFNDSFTPAYAWKPIAVETSYKYESSNRSFTYLWDNFFNYNNTFGKHSVNAIAGMSAQHNQYRFLSGAKDTFLRPENNQIDNGMEVNSLNGNTSEWALLSYIVRANYTFDNKYMLTATVRRDGSSRFGKENRWGTFPSFSGAWRISEESWFNKTTWLSDLKLRAGFGITGNQNIGNYGFASVYNLGVYSFNGNMVNTLVPHKMPNPNIRWEEVKQTNIGVDVSLLNQRIYVSLDAYLKNTNDMLVPMSVPISSGYSDQDVPDVNAGKVQNKGLELSINTQNFTGAFEWNTSFNISFNKNKIKDLNSDTPMFHNSIAGAGVTIQAVGHPINSFYGYVTDGIFQNQEEVDNHAVQSEGKTAPGDIRFKDLNNDGVIDDKDRTYIGNPTPDVMFALTNNFSYRNFDLEIFFQGVAGNEIYNANRIWQEGMSVPQNQLKDVIYRWNGEGSTNLIPRAVYGDPNKNTRHSDRFIENGSYLRLKNLTLGYTLPAKISRKVFMENFRVYFTAQNLFTISKYSGFDPEVGVNGIDLSNYPLTRSFSFGLNVKF